MKKMLDELKKNEKDVCVTIVMNGKFNSFDDKEKLQTQFRKIIATTKKVIAAEHGEKAANSIGKELNAQLFNLDFSKARETLLVYSTEGFSKTMWLPYTEKERLAISNSFDLQPLMNAIKRAREYWVLALSKNKTRLLRCNNGDCNELTDRGFPVEYTEQFQYDKSRFANSQKAGSYSVRDEKVDDERMRAFFRHIDHLLKPVFQKDDLPVILMGVEENINEFLSHSSFAGKVVAEIKGNHDNCSEGRIAQKAQKIALKAVVPQAVLQ